MEWVNKFNAKTENFTRFLSDPEDQQTLSKNQVLDIHYDSNKNILWLATHGGGLNRFSIDDEKFTHFNAQDGLASNTIYCILSDEKGNLWLSTDNGLTKFNPVNESFRNYKESDGLQSNQFFWGAAFAGNDGQLFFGGTNGLNSFIPNQMTDNLNIPPVAITSFKVFDKPVSFGSEFSSDEKIILSYKENFFSFEFAALDFTSPVKNQYAYMLKGFDKDWIQSGSRRYASYTNLEGGEYTFKVKGSNNDGIWNEAGASVKIQIVPPIWETHWFRLLASLLFVALLVGFYQRRVISVKRQNEKLEKQVEQRTKEVIQGKKETDNILNNVEEGLFLINPDYSIGSQYSKSFESIFENESLSGENFIDLIQKMLSEEISSTTSEFFELMFNDEIEEEMITTLSPLNQIEFHFKGKEVEEKICKFLSFKFKRIQNDQLKTEKLISTVRDVTNQIELEMQLAETEEHQKRQMDWLFNILHVEPGLLRDFIDGVKRELDNIGSSLEGTQDAKDIDDILNTIYRSMHMIKGNAALLDLNFFVKAAHEFEEIISSVKERKDDLDIDLQPLFNKHYSMQEILNEVNGLIDKIGNLTRNFRPKRSYENNQLLQSLKNMVKSLSNESAKKVDFNYTNFDQKKIPHQYRLFIKEILIQFIRNSFAHGIEQNEDREKSGKQFNGNIKIASNEQNGKYRFTYHDDGQGLNLNKLRQKALELNFASETEINQWSDSEVYAGIFKSGLSTNPSPDHISGRGVGLDIVKTKTDEYGGKITINSEAGQFCEFVVELPIDNKNEIQASKDQLELSAN